MPNPVSTQLSTQIQQVLFHYDQQVAPARLTSTVSGATPVQINWTSIITRLVATVTKLVGAVAGAPSDKRQAVIDTAMTFWKQSIEPLIAGEVGVPWLFNTLVEPAIERRLPDIIGGLYDGLLSVFNQWALGTQGGVPGAQGVTTTTMY